MTDAHCHVSGGDQSVREFLIGRDFVGVHPWEAEGKFDFSALRDRLSQEPSLGVGEIGLDRLKTKTVSPRMREVFERQLDLAAEFHRPVVLHGAKCWGDVVATIVRRFGPKVMESIPSFLFHGFSRSDGLLPDIVRLNGYISVGTAIMNDHAVNYREFVKKIPRERLLVETDRTESSAPVTVGEVLAKLAEIRGEEVAGLMAVTDDNAECFIGRKQ